MPWKTVSELVRTKLEDLYFQISEPNAAIIKPWYGKRKSTCMCSMIYKGAKAIQRGKGSLQQIIAGTIVYPTGEYN